MLTYHTFNIIAASPRGQWVKQVIVLLKDGFQQSLQSIPWRQEMVERATIFPNSMSPWNNYINPGYGLSLVDILWNASSYRQPLEQEGIQMTWIEKFWLQISLIVTKKS